MQLLLSAADSLASHGRGDGEGRSVKLGQEMERDVGGWFGDDEHKGKIQN